VQKKEYIIIIYFLHSYWIVPKIVGCVRKLYIKTSRMKLQHVNRMSFCAVIQVRALINDGGGEVQLIMYFLPTYWTILSILWVIRKL